MHLRLKYGVKIDEKHRDECMTLRFDGHMATGDNEGVVAEVSTRKMGMENKAAWGGHIRTRYSGTSFCSNMEQKSTPKAMEARIILLRLTTET